MKKRFILLILFLVITVVVAFSINKYGIDEKIVPKKLKGISIIVKDGTLTNKGATLSYRFK